MDFANLILETAGGIATLTVNRPQALNALDGDTVRELDQAFAAIGEDEAIKVVILTGAGRKAFVAGADIRAMHECDPQAARQTALRAQRLLERIELCPKPVIAAVNGYALGGGCELAMACDLRIACESARLGQPEINLGIIPGWGGTQRLPRLVGKGRALELLLTGEMVEAAEAKRIGLVNRVTADGELMSETRSLAARMAAKAPVALGLIKESVQQGLEMDQSRATMLETDRFALCFATADQKEGMAAFLEKREPRFQGR